MSAISFLRNDVGNSYSKSAFGTLDKNHIWTRYHAGTRVSSQSQNATPLYTSFPYFIHYSFQDSLVPTMPQDDSEELRKIIDAASPMEGVPVAYREKHFCFILRDWCSNFDKNIYMYSFLFQTLKI
jgi:hypothetical protein